MAKQPRRIDEPMTREEAIEATYAVARSIEFWTRRDSLRRRIEVAFAVMSQSSRFQLTTTQYIKDEALAELRHHR